MSKTRNVPQLRFPGFGESWRDQTLGQLLEFKNGYNASRESYGSGEKFINVLDIIQNATITHDKILGSVELSKSEFEKYKVEYGDILFQRSSETREEVGQANVYLDKIRPATFGGFVIRGKKVGDFVPPFMNYLLRTPQSRNEITSKSGGSTRYNVGQDTLSQVPVVLPSLPEQQKIAEFLTAVDRRIELLQAKKEKLEAYKKSVMQKIFSQKLRFKADDGSDFPDWEERKVSELFEIKRGLVLSVDKMRQLPDGDYRFPVYSSQTKNRGLTGFYNKKLYQDAMTWTTDGANAGDVNFRKGEFYCTNVCGVLISHSGDANKCMAAILNTVTRKYVSYVGNPKLMNNTMGDIRTMFPSVEEQKKISHVLASFDLLSETLDLQITHTQTWKKGLLQKMFV